MTRHPIGSLEWQLEQAETALKEIRDMVAGINSSKMKAIHNIASGTITHNVITRMAQRNNNE